MAAAVVADGGAYRLGDGCEVRDEVIERLGCQLGRLLDAALRLVTYAP